MRYFLSALLFLSFTAYASAQELSPQEAKKQIEKRGVDFSKSSFTNAVIDGDERLVRLFLWAGLEPNTHHQIGSVDIETPVSQFALSEGHLGVLEAFLQNGADPNAISSVGGISDRLIHSAVGRPKALQLLITYGARIDAENSSGMRAVHQAIMSDTTTEVRNRSLRILLRNGADPDAQVGGGRLEGVTPMMLCATNGRPEAVRILARNGAEVSIEPSGWEAPDGKTIATIAGQAGNEETARVMEELMEK